MIEGVLIVGLIKCDCVLPLTDRIVFVEERLALFVKECAEFCGAGISLML